MLFTTKIGTKEGSLLVPKISRKILQNESPMDKPLPSTNFWTPKKSKAPPGKSHVPNILSAKNTGEDGVSSPARGTPGELPRPVAGPVPKVSHPRGPCLQPCAAQTFPQSCFPPHIPRKLPGSKQHNTTTLSSPQVSSHSAQAKEPC